MPPRLTFEEVLLRIKTKHGDTVWIDKTTYVNTGVKCRCIDSEYGVWWVIPKTLMKGFRHPKRGFKASRETMVKRYGHPYATQNDVSRERARQTNLDRYGVEHHLSADVIKQKIEETYEKRHGPGITNSMHIREVQMKVSRSDLHTSIIPHWKTGELLTCAYSYEKAFVNWCSYKKIDFDWQIRIVTDILTNKGKKSIYFVDAYIKSGEFANTWIEIKGRQTPDRMFKWLWFNERYSNSQLWDKAKLISLGIFSPSCKSSK
jgi:hypothetical protein